MGELFRSDEMRLCQLLLEAAITCVAHAGDAGFVQFRDVSVYVKEVREREE
jgi:hypothetical protein